MTTQRILNFGSLNLDEVYLVNHIVRPGETVGTSSFDRYAGGKGANQSAALALAGANVSHAGQVGSDGRWLIEKLADLGVDTRFIEVGDHPTGRAVIQVDRNGQNAIFLYGGSNRRISCSHVDWVMDEVGVDSLLLLQNEINELPYILAAAKRRGMRVCLNAAPIDTTMRELSLDTIDIVVLNEVEAMELTGSDAQCSLEEITSRLLQAMPRSELVLTLGAKGARWICGASCEDVSAPSVKVIDTTGAGDTFVGFFLAGRTAGDDPITAMNSACRAAALCVTRAGAMDAIPSRAEVMSWRS